MVITITLPDVPAAKLQTEAQPGEASTRALSAAIEAH